MMNILKTSLLTSFILDDGSCAFAEIFSPHLLKQMQRSTRTWKLVRSDTAVNAMNTTVIMCQGNVRIGVRSDRLVALLRLA